MDIKFKDNSKLRFDIVKQLEYIQTPSAFRINTLINPQNAPVIVLDCSIDDNTDNWLISNNIENSYATQSGSFYSFYLHSGWLHLYQSTPPSMPNWGADFSTPHIYVGDGSSAAHDDTILQAYLADTTWATYSSRLNTWYNYLHPTT